MLNFTSTQGCSHPFFSLFASKAKNTSKEAAWQGLRRATNLLFPGFQTWHQSLLLDVPADFERYSLDENVFDKKVLLQGELPYYQNLYTDAKALITPLHLWAGFDSFLYLLFTREEWSNQEQIPVNDDQIAIAGWVLQDYSNYGLNQIIRDTEHKAIYLRGLLGTRKYIQLASSDNLSYIQFQFKDSDLAYIVWNQLKQHNILTDIKHNTLGVSNYPRHSKESFYQLIDALELILPSNESV